MEQIPDDEPQQHGAGPEAPLAVLEAPPERVGLLLADVRTRSGLSLPEVSDRLDGALGPGELMAVENGALGLDEHLFGRLAELYGVSPGDLVPPRDHLVVDLADGYMRAGSDIALLDRGVGRHDVLSRYLEMIWELRSVEPGSEVTLREEDLEVLGSSLRAEPGGLRTELEDLMGRVGSAGTFPTPAGGRRPRRVLVGLGVAIAVVTGSALLVTSDPSAGADQPGALPENPSVEIGEAHVLERGGTQTVRTGSESGGDDAAGSEPARPTAEIGTAAVQERNPDGSPGPQRTR